MARQETAQQRLLLHSVRRSRSSARQTVRRQGDFEYAAPFYRGAVAGRLQRPERRVYRIVAGEGRATVAEVRGRLRDQRRDHRARHFVRIPKSIL